MSDLEQRVAAGAALLDRERPGWWEEVDTKRLEMASFSKDVLGLVYGTSYRDGLWRLFGRIDVRRSREHGFTLRAEEYAVVDDQWSVLDRLWLAAIAERRARAESVGPTADEWTGQR